MSADNWANCPRCVHNGRAEHDRKTAEVYAQYGSVPVDEFDRLRASLTPFTPDQFQTFREDYEITGADEGEIDVSYSGQCTVCGLSHTIERRELFWAASSEVSS